MHHRAGPALDFVEEGQVGCNECVQAAFQAHIIQLKKALAEHEDALQRLMAGATNDELQSSPPPSQVPTFLPIEFSPSKGLGTVMSHPITDFAADLVACAVQPKSAKRQLELASENNPPDIPYRRSALTRLG